MTGEAESDAFRAAQERQLEAQMRAALEGVQGVVRRLVHEGSVDPRLILLAMTWVMGELAAASGLAEGLDAEEMLAEVGDELVRQAGREGLDELRAAHGRERLSVPVPALVLDRESLPCRQQGGFRLAALAGSRAEGAEPVTRRGGAQRSSRRQPA